MEKCALIIPAGGIGKRMKQSRAKQFLQINSNPLIYYTLQPFLDLEFISEMIIPTHADYIKEFSQWLKDKGLNHKILVIEGGERRQDSVYLALQKINPTVSFVMIHDAVRPFATKELISRIYQQGIPKKNLIPVIPVKDTIKQIKNGKVVHTPKRSELFAIQTPQFFSIADLKLSMDQIIKEKKEITDEAMALENSHFSVYSVEGDEANIKITTPEDLKVLERFQL